MHTLEVTLPGLEAIPEVYLKDEIGKALLAETDRRGAQINDVIASLIELGLQALDPDRRPRAPQPMDGESPEVSEKIARMDQAARKVASLARLLMEEYLNRTPDNDDLIGGVQFSGMIATMRTHEDALGNLGTNARRVLDPKDEFNAALFEIRDVSAAAGALGMLRLLGDRRQAAGCGELHQIRQEPDAGTGLIVQAASAELLAALKDVRELLQGGEAIGAAA